MAIHMLFGADHTLICVYKSFWAIKIKVIFSRTMREREGTNEWKGWKSEMQRTSSNVQIIALYLLDCSCLLTFVFRVSVSVLKFWMMADYHVQNWLRRSIFFEKFIHPVSISITAHRITSHHIDDKQTTTSSVCVNLLDWRKSVYPR